MTTITKNTHSATMVKSPRLASIDVMRGLVMLFMLLDHVRERFYYQHRITDPITIEDTEAELFFTRILAHLCAPIFVFLTGVSAWLYANPSNKAPRSPRAFLLKRGLFLVLLEVTVINFSWFGNYNALYLQVIWAIGISMIALALLSSLPNKLIAIIGLLIVFGHNALAPIQFAPGEWGYSLWTILHDRNQLFSSDTFSVFASYPVLPWIGVILLGYAIGPLFSNKVQPKQRQRDLLTLSASVLTLLAVLRGFNIYGEALPWQLGSSHIETIMSFLNFTKYPPSLHFILLTLGIAFALLALFETFNNKATSALKTYGSAPMFFYVFHLYVLLIAYKLAMLTFGPNAGDIFGFAALWQVWCVSAILAVVLYFPTRAFANYKHTSNQAWIKYL
ncbi:heparan-alpha-glucosaminide N-acetyltransferase domain-containing protein [Agarivorans sp. TSD2052]|uniref:DUF1624 domain-containing protein n=1 Tax=Agarivorans sp. TSD2052 TaxID=2937286 RepID=UPI00200D307C|nr:heparan-alpha-glucosaminide N-acetyltransferase domain-containing protein [Agarivorans sp. TSD2052]UPW19940.1 heparan-alpha-glucosaminide N-acetyltransferase domain-containing protein [Agarivorans sp. TSD2052]